MAIAIIVLGVVLGIAAVLWFLLGRTPEVGATHAGEPPNRAERAGRDVAGPADAGAEDMAVPDRGQVGPSEEP